jgi:hypothetical protein
MLHQHAGNTRGVGVLQYVFCKLALLLMLKLPHVAVVYIKHQICFGTNSAHAPLGPRWCDLPSWPVPAHHYHPVTPQMWLATRPMAHYFRVSVLALQVAITTSIRSALVSPLLPLLRCVKLPSLLPGPCSAFDHAVITPLKPRDSACCRAVQQQLQTSLCTPT